MPPRDRAVAKQAVGDELPGLAKTAPANDLPALKLTWSRTRTEKELEVDWLCEGLRIAEGPPTLVAGDSHIGKSMLLHDLAIAVATGGECLGHECRQGTVVYIDFDNAGQHLLERRHQQLCEGRGISPNDLSTSFAFVHAQNVDLRIDDPAFEALMRDQLKGVALVVVDAWIGAIDFTDELNRQQVRRVFDSLARISLATHCSFIIADHFVKPPAMGSTRDPIHNITGSKGKVQGSQAVFLMLRNRDGSVSFEQRKERYGKHIAPISLSICGDDDSSVMVQVNDATEAAKANAKSEAERQAKADASLDDLVFAFITSNPRADGYSKDEISSPAGVGKNRSKVGKAVDRLVAAGKLEERGGKRRVHAVA